MTGTARNKLPPMTALEFTISKTFLHFFFGLWLAVLWTILLLPFLAAVYYAAFANGMPDFKALPPLAMATFAALGVALLLATFSIAVNWHRRILLDEKPRRLGWVRLNGVVWTYLLGFLLVVIVMGFFAGAIFALMTYGVPALEPQLKAAAKPAATTVAVLLGLSALFTWYRLSSWLPALATGDREYTLGTAWRTTKKNRIRFLGFTFWLLFSLAIAGGLGAGAFFAQQMLDNFYVTIAAFALIGILGWLVMFLLMSIATSHYACFSGREGTAVE
jgi:membrane protease YdiL (CAAX protease family)